MTSKWIQDIFTTNFHFAPEKKRCLDVVDVSPEEIELAVDRDTKNIREISNLPRLQKLCVSNVKTDIVEEVAKLSSLRVLCIQYCNSGYEDLSPLEELKGLQCLILSELRKPRCLGFLSNLQKLEGLEIDNLRQVRDLSPIGKRGDSLLELKVETGGMLSGQLAMESLAPLSSLSRLEYLWLYVLSKDKSLEPLAILKNLKKLGINGLYRWEEYAKLDARLPDTECFWFKKKIINWKIECSKCGLESKVGLPGKGKRMACSSCQPHKVDELISCFDEQFALSLGGGW